MDVQFKDITIYEDVDKIFTLTISVGHKISNLDITEEQAEKIKNDLGIEISYLPF